MLESITKNGIALARWRPIHVELVNGISHTRIWSHFFSFVRSFRRRVVVSFFIEFLYHYFYVRVRLCIKTNVDERWIMCIGAALFSLCQCVPALSNTRSHCVCYVYAPLSWIFIRLSMALSGQPIPTAHRTTIHTNVDEQQKNVMESKKEWIVEV